MGPRTRAELARRALAGYEHGPDASIAAAMRVREGVSAAVAAVLVEGISDQIAVEALAERRGRSLSAEGVLVVPMGGAQAIGRHLQELGPAGEGLELVGLCDADAVETYCRGLARAGFGRPRSVADLAGLGFQVCVDDLEDELIRAVGPERVVDVVEAQAELGPFRTFQRQPAWRDSPLADQLHRFLASKSSRSLRYARLLVAALDLDQVPAPLDAVLDGA